MLANQVLPAWEIAIELGQLNEQVIDHEFSYQGIPLIRTPKGKQDFDRFLPDGRSVEIKLDLRSQTTDWAVLEEPTYNRAADLHIHTLTYAVVLTREQVEQLYRRGKVVKIGQQQYSGQAVTKQDMKQTGVYLSCSA
jgi:hypothetical protein